MFKWFDWVWRIVVAIIGIMIIWKFWLWWRPDPPTTYLRTDLINAQQSDTFYTGFATVALVRFDTGGRELQPFSFIENERNSDDVDGFCYRLYEVSIGYPSLKAAIENSESSTTTPQNEDEALATIEEPEVLSGNVIEARHGGSATQYLCDRLNEATADRPNAERLATLKRTLIENEQWDSHVSHARNVLTAFSRSLAARRQSIIENRIDAMDERRRALTAVADAAQLDEWKAETRSALAVEESGRQGQRALDRRSRTGISDLDEILDEPGVPQGTQERGIGPLDVLKQTLDLIFSRELLHARVRLADAGGYLGSLKLTFSTIGIFGQERGRWFWKRGEFYIRQDLADATYGSDFALDVSRMTVGLFGPKRLEITVPEPRLLALDRYTKVLVAKPPKFKRAGDEEGTQIEDALSGDLARQLARVEPQAIRFAQAAMTAHIHALVESDVGEVRIRFSPLDRAPPQQLMDLVRLMRSSEQQEADGTQ